MLKKFEKLVHFICTFSVVVFIVYKNTFMVVLCCRCLKKNSHRHDGRMIFLCLVSVNMCVCDNKLQNLKLILHLYIDIYLYIS